MMESGSSKVSWTLAIGAVLMSTLAGIAYDPTRIAGNCALYLEAGARILEGQMPYVDLVDTNPPLVLYLNVIPAAVARMLGIGVIPTFLVGVWLLTVASVAATRRILTRAFDDCESTHANLVAASFAVLSFLLWTWREFGDREHLFVLGFVPYLAFRFRRWERGQGTRWSALTAGVVGGIAACLKPHFVAIALAPELYWVFARRAVRPLFKPEAWAFAGAGLAYALHVLLMPDAMRTAFFGRWLPLVYNGYHVYDYPLAWMVGTKLDLWLPTAATALVFLLKPSRAGTAWKLARPLAAVAVTAAVSVLVQSKGWSYHAIPVRAALFAVVALVAAESRFSLAGWDHTTSPGILTMPVVGWHAVLMMMLGGLTVIAVTFTLHPKTEERLAHLVEADPIAQAIVRYTSPGDSVLFADTNSVSAYPLLTQLGRRRGSRFLTLFPIAMLFDGVRSHPGQPFPYRHPSNVAEEARFQADLREDIRSHRPKLILMQTGDSSCGGCPAGFTVRDYLEQTGFIADALVGYRDAGRATEGFALYVLKSGSPE